MDYELCGVRKSEIMLARVGGPGALDSGTGVVEALEGSTRETPSKLLAVEAGNVLTMTGKNEIAV